MSIVMMRSPAYKSLPSPPIPTHPLTRHHHNCPAQMTTTTTTRTTLEGRQQLARRIAAWILKHRHLRTITDKDLLDLIDHGIELLRTVPSFLHVRTPVIIIGDLHGQLPELLEFFKRVASELLELNAPRTNLLFLGDYVDRGKYSLEVITLLLCLKLIFPERINLLRGNHECSDVNKRYGFYNEIMAKKCGNYHLWTRFNQLFKELSVCALVSGKILCMHGGLPRPSSMQQWSDLTDVKKSRTVSECYDDRPIVNDLLWADPTDKQQLPATSFNTPRNTSIMFTDEYIQEFVERYNPNIEAIVRAHEHTPQGYKLNRARNLCTIFSAPCYQDRTDHGAVLTIPADGDGRIKVTILRPMDKNSSSSDPGTPSTPLISRKKGPKMFATRVKTAAKRFQKRYAANSRLMMKRSHSHHHGPEAPWQADEQGPYLGFRHCQLIIYAKTLTLCARLMNLTNTVWPI